MPRFEAPLCITINSNDRLGIVFSKRFHQTIVLYELGKSKLTNEPPDQSHRSPRGLGAIPIWYAHVHPLEEISMSLSRAVVATRGSKAHHGPGLTSDGGVSLTPS
jgi:hypothetical protein